MKKLDRIMVNQLVIMNALRLAASNKEVAKDLTGCSDQTICDFPRVHDTMYAMRHKGLWQVDPLTNKGDRAA